MHIKRITYTIWFLGLLSLAISGCSLLNGSHKPGDFQITVQGAGSGAGTITSSPAGITCGQSCSASFPGGTAVTLSAAPSAGSTFAGWSGGCSGTGACS